MKKGIAILSIIISIFGIYSCDPSDNNDLDQTPELRPMTAQEEVIIESANDFAFDIFARVNALQPDDNLFISPLSISTALSMTANGAAGDTWSGIKKTLHLEDVSDDEMNEAYKTLVPYLMNLDPKVTIDLANSNWYRQEFNIRETFRKILLEYYGAEIKAADFKDPATKDLINQWIADKTNGKIKNMIDRIPPDAIMYLINAIYFKATWQYQFEKDKTKLRDFHLADGSTIQTETMYSKGITASFYQNNDLQFIELPYGNGPFVFTIILPENASELNNILNSLDERDFSEFIQNTDTSSFEMYLPKFKIEYKIGLNDILSAMGMAQSFGDQADFSRLFEEGLDLYISRVLHQSFIEVDEEGTEAAAATVVEVGVTSVGPGTPKVLNIDRSFAFFIREKNSNAILFAGKIMNPSAN